MLDDALLQAFIDGFYGYGNYQAPYWFVGMEEGGGNTLDEIALRLDAWRQRGRREVEDLAGYHRAIGITRFFDEWPVLQRTWSKLIRVLFAIEGREATAEQIREYQRCCLGRADGETCLVELLPLPSPGTNRWLYGAYSRLPFLRDRRAYVEQVGPRRVAHLRRRLAEHKPRVVLFYSLTYLPWWEEVAEGAFRATRLDRVAFARNGGSLHVVTRHPVGFGAGNDYFDRIGELIASELGGA